MSDVADNPFAQNLARILKYGTSEFSTEVSNLITRIKEKFPKEYIDEQAIRSWLKGPKLPRTKSLYMVAEALGIKDPWDLYVGENHIKTGGIPEKELAFINRMLGINSRFFLLLQETIEEAFKLYKDDYLEIKKLDPTIKKVIQMIAEIRDPDLISNIESHVISQRELQEYRDQRDVSKG